MTATEHPSGEAAAPLGPAASEERPALVVQWAERHGVEVAQRLADAEDFVDEVQRRLRPANTTDTYAKAWRVWERFCAAQGFPELEATRGALVAFVVWLLDRGQVNEKGYAASSAGTILAGAVVELRRRGAEVSRDDQAQARATLEAAAVELLKAGERRGRGQAAAAEGSPTRRPIAGKRTSEPTGGLVRCGEPDLVRVAAGDHLDGGSGAVAGMRERAPW